MDLTEVVNRKIKTDAKDDKIPVVDNKETQIFGGEDDIGWNDVQLFYAAKVVQNIRSTIYNELGYTCSAGNA